jgi:DNA-binding response OmpR family regulator
MSAKILIIEDDESIAEALKTALEFDHYTVKVLISGNQALRITKSFKPSLILLDYLLSGTDGKKISQALKKNIVTKNIPIILMSAHPTAKVIAKEAGIDGFLAKPFTIETLTKTIETFMRA